ncbi:MAG: hypothetical protein NE334_07885 [Lentisphaeraceae bacterium]|nr:hypothetical protein [Lentisphaeraceae bacterium]
MRRNFLYKTGALILMLLLLVSSSFQQLKLDSMRNEMGINDSNDIGDKSPAVVFTTIALGSFRGFIANLLFLRSNRMQEERRYYELHQLAKWIRNLQPRYTKAIAFMAWNMSYNISVTFDTPQERWVWVRKGIDLYLDAIKNHSGDPDLYWEFGWIFQHKMGMNLDDANRYYKQQWALMMVKLLKENPDMDLLANGPRNPGILHSKLDRLGFKEFTELLDAYKMPYSELSSAVLASKDFELPAKITKYIKDEKQQAEIVEFIKRTELKRHEPETIFYLLDGIVDFEKVLAETSEKWDFENFEKRFRELGRLPQDVSDGIVLAPKAKKEIVDLIDSFMRDKWAWDEYRLDVRRMSQINDEYGALDWRVAETHAIYWAKVGLDKNPDHIQCTRMVSQALKDVVDRGRLLYFTSETHQSIDWTYNVDIVDTVSELLEENIENLPEDKRSTFETGYRNFLIDAVVAMYTYNKKKRAKFYYDKLKKRDPGNPNYKKPLNQFVTPEVGEDLGSMNEDQARLVLEGFLIRSFQQVLYGEDQAVFWFTRAANVYQMFKKKTANRKGRQGWTSSFSDMAIRAKDYVIKQVPERALDINNFYDSLIKSQSSDEKK